MTDLGLWMASQRDNTAVVVLFPDCLEQLRIMRFESDRRNLACQGSGSNPRYCRANATGSRLAISAAFALAWFNACCFSDNSESSFKFCIQFSFG